MASTFISYLNDCSINFPPLLDVGSNGSSTASPDKQKAVEVLAQGAQDAAQFTTKNTNALKLRCVERLDLAADCLQEFLEESILVTNRTQRAVMPHLGRSSGLLLGTELSNILNDNKNRLPGEVIRTLKKIQWRTSEVTLVLHSTSDNLLSSLQKIEKELGPVVGLTLADKRTTDAQVHAICKACKSIKELIVRGTAITDLGFASIVTNLTQLKVLDVRFCEGISFSALLLQNYGRALVDLYYTRPNDGQSFIPALHSSVKGPINSTVLAEWYVYSPLNQKKASLTVLDTLLKAHPNCIPALVSYADLLRLGSADLNRDVKRGRQMALRSYVIDPLDARGSACFARYLLADKVKESESLREAKRLVQGSYRKALLDDMLLATLARIHLLDRDFHAALDYANRAIAIYPNNAYAIATKGAAYMMLQTKEDLVKAEILLEHAYELCPLDTQILCWLCRVYIQMGDKTHVEEAIVLLQHELQTTSDHALVHRELARYYYSLNPEIAIEHIEKALLEFFDNTELLHMHACLLFSPPQGHKEDIGHALSLCDRILQIDPNYVPTLVLKGCMLRSERCEELQNHPLSQELLEKALFLDRSHTNPILLSNLAESLLYPSEGCEQDIRRGIWLLEQARKCDKTPTSTLKLADFYLDGNQKQKQEAMLLFHDLIQKFPDNENVCLASAHFLMTDMGAGLGPDFGPGLRPGLQATSFQLALDLLNRMRTKVSNNPDLYLLTAVAELKLTGNVVKADEQLTHALQLKLYESHIVELLRLLTTYPTLLASTREAVVQTFITK